MNVVSVKWRRDTDGLSEIGVGVKIDNMKKHDIIYIHNDDEHCQRCSSRGG